MRMEWIGVANATANGPGAERRKMFNLYLFNKQEKPGESIEEYVVISDLTKEEVLEESVDDYSLAQIIPIDGDATIFPCDRALISANW